MSQLDQLYHLQQLDNELRVKKARLGEVLAAQKEAEPLLAARKRATSADAALKKWRLQQRDLNLELEGINSKAKRSEGRLYSGNVKNPKELEDLQHEIQSLGRRRETLEEEIIEAMIGVEEAEAEHETAVAERDELEATWQVTLAGLHEEQTKLAHRINELIAARQDQAGRLSPESLDLYQRTGGRRGGVAVVAIKDSRCMGCQLSVPASTARAAGQGQLTFCSSCGRILYPL